MAATKGRIWPERLFLSEEGAERQAERSRSGATSHVRRLSRAPANVQAVSQACRGTPAHLLEEGAPVPVHAFWAATQAEPG
jgi:hypothetical protein